MHSTRFIRIIVLLVIAFSNVKGQTEFPFSIAQYVDTTENLTTLKQVISNPGLTELFTVLDGNNSFTTGPKTTLFAPTNEAFASSGIDIANVPMMLNLIKYHIAPGEISTGSSSNFMVVETLLNDSSLVQLPNGDGQALYLTSSFQGNENIVSNGDSQQGKIIGDVECSNGIIHLIDTVIIPPRSLIDTANSLELTQFIDVFTKANLLPSINVTRGVTVFVPTNEAFEALEMDTTKRDSLLPLHVINGTVVYEIKAGKSDQTVSGDTLNFKVKNEGGLNTTIYVNNAKVEKTILIGNGVMYVINTVLLPEEGGQDVDDGPNDDDNKETKNDDNKKKDDDGVGGKRVDKKLIIGSVMGGICGGIVISLTSCMVYKWYKAQKSANVAATGEVLKTNTIT